MRRMAIAIASAVAIMVVAGLVYILTASRQTVGKFNGAAIVAAARAYTQDLQDRKQPIPSSITLEELAALHFLNPGDITAFRGLKANIALTADNRDPQTVLMRVLMPDGVIIELLGDGTVREAVR
jgi:hypothetical protein